jgi:ankyrin repeat protein
MTAAVQGHVDTVRSLLDKPGIDIDAQSAVGNTALDYACFNRQLEVAKLLVAAGARVNPQASNDGGALVSAVIGGSLQLVKYLVEEARADVQCAGPKGSTLFMHAAHGGHVDVVEYLLGRQDIDIDAKTPEGYTALDLACLHCQSKVVKRLVAAGARINAQASNEWGPLLSAAVGGSLQVVKYLVEEAGADGRWADADGMTVLMSAATEGHLDVVEYLLGRQDIDMDAKNAEGNTALAFACSKGHLEMAKLLVAAGARMEVKAGEKGGALIAAASGGSLQVVKYLVEKAGADVQRTGLNGITALMMADFRGHSDVAEYLQRAISRREYEVNVALASVEVHVYSCLT